MPYELIVVGGGIAGLTLARRAHDAGHRTLLLEATPRLGGALHTFRPTADFWLELGAHTLFNSYGHLIELLALTGLDGQLIPRQSLPYRLWTERGARTLFSELRPWELLRRGWQLPFRRRDGQSVAEYYEAIVGPGNFAEVVGPALDAMLCQPTAGFPADTLFRPKPRQRQLPRSFSLPGGLSTLVERLAEGLEVRTDAGVESIERAGTEGFRVRCAEAQWETERVVVATGSEQALRPLLMVAPGTAGKVGRIPLVTVESLGVVVAKDQVKLPPIAGLIGRRQPFFSVVSRDPIPHPQLRGFTFHFRPGLLDAAGRRAAAAAVLGTTHWEAEAFAAHHLPSLPMDHHERIAAAYRLLPRGVGISGNYLDGLSLEECVRHSQALHQQWFSAPVSAAPTASSEGRYRRTVMADPKS